MPAGGDIIELTHEQTYLGQVMNNVYFFEAAVADASMSDLATWFETNVVPDVKAAQNELVTHTNLRLRNLFNLAETYEEPLTGTGTQTSADTEIPAFVACSIRLDHISSETRPGFKRYSGMTEGNIINALVSTVQVTNLGNIAANLVNPPADVNADWAHVIVGRVCDELNPVVGAVPRCLRYVLPRTQAEAAEAGIGYPVSFEVNTQPTSQNSRKWYT